MKQTTSQKRDHSFVQRLSSLTDKDVEETEDFFAQKSIDGSGEIVPTEGGQPLYEDSEAEEPETWMREENYEGQLAVDVFQTPQHIIIQSTIAGVRPEDLDISFTNDTLTIRGIRRKTTEISEEDYFYSECYWGGFSRSIILPVDVKEDKIDAKLENGILTITIPKIHRPASKSIPVKEIPS